MLAFSRPVAPILLAFCLAAATAHAGENLNIQPGKWQIRIETTSAMLPAPQIVDRTECVTDSEWDPDELARQAEGCKISDVRSTGDRLQWKMACAAPGGQMQGEGDYRSTGDTVEGTMTMALDASGVSMKMDTTYSGKRLGDCD